MDSSFRGRLRKRWRVWLRAVHRDLGYLAVGLTFVYAISGIAINHISEWDPNFKSVVESSTIKTPLPVEDEDALTSAVAAHLQIAEDEVRAAFFDDSTTFEVSFPESVARLDTESGVVKVASKEPRFLLRAANWLHVNRGKAAWTYIADGYAFLLLYLATSGMFMLKGRKGLRGRGGILIMIGAAVPIAYVQLASGP